MELNEVNPHLRFVRTLNYEPRKNFLKAVDYHFYFMLSDFCVLEIEDDIYNLEYGTVIIIPPGMKYV